MKTMLLLLACAALLSSLGWWVVLLAYVALAILIMDAPHGR
ncbi:hypothetical protein [Burkholderia cepacia]|nr:hypothetical protein [Burkholderia cepacia]